MSCPLPKLNKLLRLYGPAYLHGSLLIRWETVNVLGLRTQDQQVRMHYCVLIIIFTVDNFVMGLTLRPVEARPNRKAENGSGVIGKGQRRSESPRRDLWEQCKLSQ